MSKETPALWQEGVTASNIESPVVHVPSEGSAGYQVDNKDSNTTTQYILLAMAGIMAISTGLLSMSLGASAKMGFAIGLMSLLVSLILVALLVSGQFVPLLREIGLTFRALSFSKTQRRMHEKTEESRQHVSNNATKVLLAQEDTKQMEIGLRETQLRMETEERRRLYSPQDKGRGFVANIPDEARVQALLYISSLYDYDGSPKIRKGGANNDGVHEKKPHRPRGKLPWNGRFSGEPWVDDLKAHLAGRQNSPLALVDDHGGYALRYDTLREARASLENA